MLRKEILRAKLSVLLNHTSRSSHRRCSVKKETLAQVFSCEFCEISKNTFFTEPLLGDCFCLVQTFMQESLKIVFKL